MRRASLKIFVALAAVSFGFWPFCE